MPRLHLLELVAEVLLQLHHKLEQLRLQLRAQGSAARPKQHHTQYLWAAPDELVEAQTLHGLLKRAIRNAIALTACSRTTLPRAEATRAAALHACEAPSILESSTALYSMFLMASSTP